jgi:hypothetical protein
LRNDIVAFREISRRKQTDLAVDRLHMLEHGDGIGPAWNGSASHDLPDRARRKRPGWGFSRTRGARDRHPVVSRQLTCPAGEPIPRRSCKGRLVSICADGLGKDAAGCKSKRNPL